MDIDGWSPENFGGEYNGRVTIAEAFARSLNAATVALAQEVGIDEVAASARELGIDAKLTETPALALGASEVTPDRPHWRLRVGAGERRSCRTVRNRFVPERPTAAFPCRPFETT